MRGFLQVALASLQKNASPNATDSTLADASERANRVGDHTLHRKAAGETNREGHRGLAGRDIVGGETIKPQGVALVRPLNVQSSR